jgi:hypothetical protein
MKFGDADIDGPSLWKGTMGGSCKDAYDPFHSMKDGKFLE